MIIDNTFLANRPLSYSSLKEFRKSPMHYIARLTKPFVQTPAMLLGSVVDMLALTPEKFEDKMAVSPKFDKRTKQGKADFEAFEIQHQGKLILNEETHEIAKAIVNAMKSHPVASLLLENKIRAQIRMEWKDTATKLPLIGYADLETQIDGEIFLVDLKTTRSADPNKFEKDFYNLEYYLQAAMYLDAYHKAKFRFPKFLILAVESTEPYGVSVHMVDNAAIDFGKDEFYGTMVAFKYAMDNNLFHQSYEFRLFDTIKYHTLGLPGYKKKIFGQ